MLGPGWRLVCGHRGQSSSDEGDNILIFNVMQPWTGVGWWLAFGVLVLVLRAVDGRR